MTDPETRFWMVWSPQGRMPTRRHYCRDDADREAQRLARLNPMQEFFVLKAMGGFACDEPSVRTIRLKTDPDFNIPF
ncbi:hypothetical protein [Oceaniradius stylonematis]|uniref:hypothetical protein n=1 Tax=Oceaniradius stylonematis TaxID=2184161 RepID=UPI00273F7CA4|nr:hypothetical protein [Oceaniradius stylonematis]